MGHELTNLFILAGTLFLLFIGCLALQLASTEKRKTNITFIFCCMYFSFPIFASFLIV